MPPLELCRFCGVECPAPCNHFTDRATGKTDAVCGSCAQEIRGAVGKYFGYHRAQESADD